MIRIALQALLFILPWGLRRRALSAFFRFDIAPTARIGFSVILAQKLIMEPYAFIGHLNFVGRIREVRIGEHGILGKLNRVSGMPIGNTDFYRDDPDRDPSLLIERHASITNSHIIDCTDRVVIGEFTTFAGWHSQILTHSFDFDVPRQRAQPVTIGRRCFVGTSCVILPGAVLPDRSILGAKSLLHRPMSEEETLYSGVPAQAVRKIDPRQGYFTREVGYIN